MGVMLTACWPVHAAEFCMQPKACHHQPCPQQCPEEPLHSCISAQIRCRFEPCPTVRSRSSPVIE